MGKFEESCDICGHQRINNIQISADNLSDYLDGPPRISFSTVVVCSDCAEEVSEYLQERTDDSTEPPKQDPIFSRTDAKALLDRVVENNRLVLDAGIGYGIRYLEEQWKHAIVPLPEGHQIRTLEQTEVEELIINAPRVIMKRLDPSAWRRHELNRAYSGPTLQLTDVHTAKVRGVEVHRFRLYFNEPLPDEEYSYLKGLSLKYKSINRGRLHCFQFQRQDRPMVADMWEELRERYASEMVLEGFEFLIRGAA